MRNKRLWAGGLAVLLILAVFLAGVGVGARFHSRLAAAAGRLFHEKHVTLRHGDILTDGADGFLRDLDRRLALPEELFLLLPLEITFDGAGQVRTLSVSLRGYGWLGRSWHYTVRYDRSESEKMTVRRERGYGGEYGEQTPLAPFFALADGVDMQALLAGADQDGVWTLRYGAPGTFRYGDEVTYLAGDADGDGVQSGVTDLDVLADGGYVTGYALTVTGPDGADHAYVMEPEYTSFRQIEEAAEQSRQAQQARQVEAAKAAEGWLTDSNDGTMYFFLDGETGWRLVETGWALGSRSYALERTEDGGANWERVCADPFEGRIGVAEGLVFFGPSLGFAGLAGASQDYSRLYVTRDGGETFAPVELPMDEADPLPALGIELGFTAADYDYLTMPERTGDGLTVTALTQSGEREGLVFRSEDQGMTWAFQP